MSEQAQWQGQTAAITVPDDSTADIKAIRIRQGANTLWMRVLNSAHSALDVFNVQISPFSDTTYHTIADVASDFTTNIQWPILGVETDPTSLAKSTASLIAMDCRGLEWIKCQGSAANTSDTTVTVQWQQR